MAGTFTCLIFGHNRSSRTLLSPEFHTPNLLRSDPHCPRSRPLHLQVTVMDHHERGSLRPADDPRNGGSSQGEDTGNARSRVDFGG